MEHLLTYFGITDIKELTEITKVLIRILLIMLLASILLRFSTRIIRSIQLRLRNHIQEDLEEIKRIETLGQVFHYIATCVIFVVAGMEILHQIGISIAPILAAAGVVGVALGLGAQNLIKDYFNGFFILLENQIRQGDVIEAAGKGGLVEEITLRHVRMRDYDGNVHFIPNSVITTVTNMSRGFAQSVIDVRVAAKQNLDHIMEIMLQVGKELRKDKVFSKKILDDLEMAGVDKWEDAAVILKARFKVTPLDQWDVRREYLRRLTVAFDKEEIK